MLEAILVFPAVALVQRRRHVLHEAESEAGGEAVGGVYEWQGGGEGGGQ